MRFEGAGVFNSRKLTRSVLKESFFFKKISAIRKTFCILTEQSLSLEKQYNRILYF